MRIPKKRNNSGFTLIELIMTIVIAAIVLTPTSIVVVESVRNTYMPEYLTRGASLLKREVERVSILRFNDVINEGPINYTGNFGDYTYQINFYYVNGNDLNTQVGGPTDYKRVTITISHPNFPNVSAVALVTNN